MPETERKINSLENQGYSHLSVIYPRLIQEYPVLGAVHLQLERTDNPYLTGSPAAWVRKTSRSSSILLNTGNTTAASHPMSQHPEIVHAWEFNIGLPEGYLLQYIGVLNMYILLHELGHEIEYQQCVEQYIQPFGERYINNGLSSLPIPDKTPSQMSMREYQNFFNSHSTEMTKQGISSPEQLMRLQQARYGVLPAERFAHTFARKNLKKYKDTLNLIIQ